MTRYDPDSNENGNPNGLFAGELSAICFLAEFICHITIGVEQGICLEINSSKKRERFARPTQSKASWLAN